MIRSIINFRNRRDWKGYPLLRKSWILGLFTVKPIYAWQKYPDDFYRAYELDQNELCKDKSLMDSLLNLKYGNGNTRVLMSLREMLNIYNLVSKVKDLDGDMAEVGVYQGGSALIISKAKGDKSLHLFDTFEGLPDPDPRLDRLMLKGDMNNTSISMIREKMKPYKNIFLYQGLFPQTASPVENNKFCFVNNDTDIYTSTKAFLEFFYPRMVPKGIILTHDYNDSRTPGVKTAFDEFFANKPEIITEIWDTQAYVVKL